MLDELIAVHREIMKSVPSGARRYLYDEVNWDLQALCILGDRGVGKTTMVCQHLLNTYQTQERGLYISADNVTVLAQGLFKTAMA